MKTLLLISILLFGFNPLFANDTKNKNYELFTQATALYEDIKKDDTLKKKYMKQLGNYLLIVAVKKNDVAFTKELLSHDADINFYTIIGKERLREFGPLNPLLAASNEKNYEAVKFLLENGANINTKDTYNQTALSYALYDSDTKDRELIKYLLKNGVDANIEFDDYRYALSDDFYRAFNFALVFSKDLEIIKMVAQKSDAKLLTGYEQNHTTNWLDKWHRKEFSFSCERLQLALKYTEDKENISLRDRSIPSYFYRKYDDYNNPFSKECSKEDAFAIFFEKNLSTKEIEKIIEDEKLRISQYVQKRDYALNLLKKRKYEELYKHIENTKDLNTLSNSKKNSFLTRVLSKYRYDKEKNKKLQKIAKLLIQKGADADQGYFDKFLGSSPFEDAMRFKSVHSEYDELVELMAKNGANPNTKYYEDKRKTYWTPLFYALSKKNETLFDILLQNGADIDYVDEKGLNLFYFAIFNQAPNLAKKLIDAGYKANLNPKTARHPLAMAAFNSDIDSLKYLISLGYNPNETILGRKNLFEFILTSPNKDLKRPQYASKKISLETFKYVINLCKDELNKPSDVNYAFLALLKLEKQKGIDVAKLLLENGLSLDENTKGYSPLQYALRNDNYIVKRVEFLLAQNIDINHQDKDGDTPLHESVIRYNDTYQNSLKAKNHISKSFYTKGLKELTKTIIILLHNGADSSLKNNKGLSALDLAKCKDKKIKCKIYDIIDILKEQ